MGTTRFAPPDTELTPTDEGGWLLSCLLEAAGDDPGLAVPAGDAAGPARLAAVELRARRREARAPGQGPNITTGYLGRPDLTAAAFDEDGFLRTGDADCLVDPRDGSRGIVSAGRIAEDFELTGGTWVSVGALRIAALAAVDGVLQDAVVTGQDRDDVGLLAWVNSAAARRILPESVDVADPAAVAASPAVVQAVRDGLARHNAAAGGSSTRIARVLLLTDPPSLDAGEISDKGYVNQRAVLDRRADDVVGLHEQESGAGGLEIVPRSATVPV